MRSAKRLSWLFVIVAFITAIYQSKEIEWKDANVVNAQTTQRRGRQIKDLPPVTASQISDDTLVHFGVDKTDSGDSYRISLAELKKTQADVRNVKQYGALGDWDNEALTGNDDTTAIQNAIDATPEGGTLFFPEGHYRFGGATITKPITIYGPGVLVVNVNEYGFDVDLSSYWGNSIEVTANTDYQISASATPVVEKFTTAVAHGLAQGDVIKLSHDNAYFVGSGTGLDYHADIYKVIKVIDTTNFVVDRDFTIYDLSVSDAHIRKLPTGRINIQVNFDVVPGGEETERTTEAPLVSLNGAIDPIITVNAVKSYSTILQCKSLYKGDIKVNAGEIDGLSTVGSSVTSPTGTNPLNEECRGVQLYACHGTSVQALIGGGQTAVMLDSPVYKASYLTSTSFMQDIGKNRHVTIHDSVSHGSYQAGFMIKIGSDNTVVSDCAAISNVLLDTTHSSYWPIGFFNGGAYTQFNGCEVKGGRFGFYLYGDVFTSGTNPHLVGCSDSGVTEVAIECATTSSKLSPVEIVGHSSQSSCTFIHTNYGTVHCRNSTIRHESVVTGPTFDVDGGVQILILEDIFHIMRANSDYGTIIQVGTGASDTSLIVNDYYMLTEYTGTVDSFLSAANLSEVRADFHNISYQTLDLEGTEAINFPAEHLIDDSSTGTITFVSDKFQNGRRHEFGTAAPTTERHEVGDIVWHSAPAAGGNIGWVCTTAGTPGTWKTFGTIAP